MLIAMPQLQDPYFSHTTTLITEFSTEGAMGVVLNRRLDLNLEKLMDKNLKLASLDDVHTYWGGPVQNERGLVIHEDDQLESDSVKITDQLYISGSTDALKILVENKTNNPAAPSFRLYLGYAGWGPGQLEKEIAGASWVMTPLDRGLIFDSTTDTLWKRSLTKIGVDPAHLAAAPHTQAH